MSSPDINATAASLLGFLHARPMAGWDLNHAVRDTIGNFWNVTRSQVYRELRTLAALGYIKTGDTGARERRPYEITRSGRTAFARWIARDPAPPTIRMPLLLTVFFGEHLPPGRLAEIVAAERPGHVQALEEFRAIYGACRESDPFVSEVVRFGIGYNQLVLDWLDSLLTDVPGWGKRHRTEEP